MKKQPSFIIVDDDPVNNTLCRILIRKALGDIDILTFLLPEEALHFITHHFPSQNCEVPVILLLDLNMPVMNGWEFLEEYHKLDRRIKNQIKVYILSSSVDAADKQRAASNRYVTDYIEKPLRKEVLLSIACAKPQAGARNRKKIA